MRSSSTRSRVETLLNVTVMIVLMAILILTVTGRVSLPWAVVGSYSMVPTLELGDMVLYSTHIDVKSLEGKVVVYTVPNTDLEIVHRVVEVWDGKVRTKGDANPGPLPFERALPLSYIKGIVTLTLPYVGFMVLCLKSSSGLGLLSLAIMYVITLMLLRSMLERREKAR